MRILRSREIPEIPEKPIPKQSDIKPSTPARTQEPNTHRSPEGNIVPVSTNNTTRRRSFRLAQHSEDRHEGVDNVLTDEKKVSALVSGESMSNESDRFLNLRSGKRVAKRVVDYVVIDDELEIESSKKLDFESEFGSSGNKRNNKRKRDFVDLVEDDVMVHEDIKTEKGETVLEENQNKNKGKGLLLEDSDDAQVVSVESYEKSSSSNGRRKYTTEEKGKGIQVENVASPVTVEIVEADEEEEEAMEIENVVVSATVMPPMVNAEQPQNHNGNDVVGNGSRNQHFREIARRNASKFAHFDAQMDEEEDLSDKEGEQQVGDWPGPFSTAMKIIKDREDDTGPYIGTSVPNKERSSPTLWVPSKNISFTPRKAPSLKELSLQILVKNSDAISSLDYVPDALRVKLCHMLCDSRRMNVHFLELLVRGSPTEICVPDSSWLTEEQFTECFKTCDTSNLMVLQLDQCGRCMPDYVIPFTLARSPKNLPLLSSLSLCGACRLSDVGLRALVSAAPAITSINLSQCSLLTSSSIDMLSDSLGSVLRELYINECQNIDLKLILPALKKFEKLEVLSLADLPSVKSRFLTEFVTARGQTLKQLILTNSGKLTDSSVKAISESCPNLTVLDLANVCKLTDTSLGFLANGCPVLEKLIFCRNSFSDEAVAAFVETAGGSLKELSLNNVKKVGHNTALALAKHSEKLQILDVSWCRVMSDDSLGYIVDNISSLKVLKLFGCTQVTDAFVKGHSNPSVKILGMKMDPFLNHLTNKLVDS